MCPCSSKSSDRDTRWWYLLVTELGGGRQRRRTRRGIDVRPQATPQDVTGYLRDQQITLTYDSGVLGPGWQRLLQVRAVRTKGS